MTKEDLIAKIDERIAILEQEERGEYLLRKALFKKGIIASIDDITNDRAEELLIILSRLLDEQAT